MMEPINESSIKKPGVVIFAAVIDFIVSAFWLLIATLSLCVLIFGNAFGLYNFMMSQITQASSQVGMTFGVNFILGVIFFATLISGLFELLVGIGLLQGKKICWYTQVTLFAIGILNGLLGFPIGIVSFILNVVLTVLFFRPAVRNYFKV